METHTLKSDEAVDAYNQALETISEADIRGAMKNDRASFQMQWNAGKANKVLYCWWKAETRKQLLKLWEMWLSYLITTFARCQTYLIFQTVANVDPCKGRPSLGRAHDAAQNCAIHQKRQLCVRFKVVYCLAVPV